MPSLEIAEEKLEKIVEGLVKEINYVVDTGSGEPASERAKIEKRWEKIRRQREVRPEKEVKSHPWEKASNVVVPMAAGDTIGIYASIKSALGLRDPFYTVKPLDKRLDPACRGLEQLLTGLLKSKHHVDLEKQNRTIIYDAVSLGTQFVEVPWLTKNRTFKRSDTSGNYIQVNQVVKNCPVVQPIRIEDFVTRVSYSDLQTAPWFGIRYHLTWEDLKQREALGIYENVDKIEQEGHRGVQPSQQKEYRGRGMNPDEVITYTIYKVYSFQDIDDDGFYEDVILFIEPKSRTVLRVELNELGVRPIVRVPYMDMPGSLYGMGVGQMLENVQDEVDSLHNMRIDGTHLSMLQMAIVKRGAGIGPKERIRPGKFWPVDNPREDFVPIKFPDIGPSSVQAEMLAKEYGDRFSGVSDYLMGFESKNIGTRATASGTMFLAQQGSKILNSIMENITDSYSEIGTYLFYQLVHNSDLAEALIQSFVEPEYQEPLRDMLSINVEEIPEKIQITVKTSDIDETEEAKRQGLLTLTQLYSMHGREVFQLLPTIYNPQVPQPIKEIAQKYFLGAVKMMERIMEHFDIEGKQDYLPYVKDIQLMTRAIEAMKDQRVGGMTGGRVQGLPGGMGAVGPGGQGGSQYAQGQSGPVAGPNQDFR